MSIDSLGGGRDPNHDARRRLLEAERERELGRIEKRHKDEVANVEEARQRSLQDIYERQTDQVESARGEAEERVRRAKAAADSRVRDFENEALKMTDEAKRQFQSKADLLARNAQELDAQRDFMIKQHDDSMKRLKSEREQSYIKQDLDLRRDAARAYAGHKKNMDEIQALANDELDRVREESQWAKTSAREEATRAITQADRQKDDATAAIARELDHHKRSGLLSLERDRATNELARTAERDKHEEQMGDIKRRSQLAVNKAHRDGKQLTQEVKSLYDARAFEAQRGADAELRAAEENNAKAAQNLESRAKLDDKLTRDAYEHRKKAMHTQREKNIADMAAESKTLQTRLTTAYKDQAKAIEADHEAKLKEHVAKTQEELSRRRDAATRQVAALTEANSRSVAAHASRSSDPFYRVHELGAQLDEHDTEVIVRVKVPEHEKDAIRLTLQREGLVLSGARRYEDRYKSDAGRKIATSSYQSYSESFPVKGKLELERMTRTYFDGQLTFRIPKS